MIKLICFDLDGTLFDCKELHFNALNNALRKIDEKYVITFEEHLSKYDGISTNQKLRILTRDKGLPEETYKEIWDNKQKETIYEIKKTFKYDERLINILSQLKEKGYKLYVVSNSIRDTIKMAILKSGLMEYIDFFMSNEDVRNPKPNPEIYLKAYIHANVSPQEVLVLEDSVFGRESAEKSGAFLLPVEKVEDVTLERIINKIDKINRTQEIKKMSKWKSDKLQVVIPMSGAGSRFEKAGYTFPKPLISIQNKPMIQVVVENLNVEAKFVYIVQKSHYEKYNLKHLLNLITPDCDIVQVDGVTEGAACSVLLAKEYINNDKQLLLANSDQWVNWSSSEFIYKSIESGCDGNILTFKSTHPKWSFAKLDDTGRVVRVEEKDPISDNASVGIYWYKKGSDFVKYAEQMIAKNVRSGPNKEFYVMPVYNEFIGDGKVIKTFEIKQDDMMGLGTPEDLEVFINYIERNNIKL